MLRDEVDCSKHELWQLGKLGRQLLTVDERIMMQYGLWYKDRHATLFIDSVCVQFEVGCRLVGHSDSVTAADAVYIGSQLLIVSASADCTLRFWLRPTASSGKMHQSLPAILV